MIYKINNLDTVIDWLPVFEALSVIRNGKFAEDVEFSVDSPELREISKVFCLSTLKYLSYFGSEHSHIGEPPSLLFVPTESRNPLIQIWENTFQSLMKFNYDEIVYKWGSRSLLIKNSNSILNTDWDDLLAKWGSGRFDKLLPPLYLTEELIIRLKIITHTYQRDIKTLRDREIQARTDIKDSWERHVGTSWITNLASKLLHLSMWKAIFLNLSEQDLMKLDRWGLEVFSTYNFHKYSSPVQFKQEIDMYK